jgi:cyclic beta-1,2-glucan synthetase
VLGNPIQEFLSQFRIPFLGENLLRKYEKEKSPLRAELLSMSQLETYAETLAQTHIIGGASTSELLIGRLNANEEVLIEVRQLLIESAQENGLISPAGEWLLDNFYLIEEQIKTARKHFPKGYSDTLPKLAKGPLAGYPRVYHVAFELISHCDGRVDIDTLNAFVQSYQKVNSLQLGELWAIPIMLRLALIENLRRLAGQMAVARINKNLAGTWADRMIAIAEKDPKSLIVATADMARSNPPMADSFVAEITRRLLGKGPALTLPLSWIEQRLAENGLTTNSLVQQETQKQASSQVSMSNSIASLRFLIGTDWRIFVEENSVVEKILREDIDGLYGQMDFHTRDHYRHKIEHLAKISQLPEHQVAREVIDLAKTHTDSLTEDPRKSHVGYYLIDKGILDTEQKLNIQFSRFDQIKRSIRSIPLAWYIGSILLITVALTFALVWRAIYEEISTGWIMAIGCIAMVVMSHLGVSITNWLVTVLVKPDFLPRMNFAGSIPPGAKTMVVVPTLIGSQVEVDDLIETMEVRYLANPQEHLHYALLTDFRDCDQEFKEEETDVLVYAQKRIEGLNKKYQRDFHDLFFIFHRPRKWNAADTIWMGHERKRGKLGDLMALLRGKGEDRFQLIVGDLQVLEEVKYILTLDTDTQLPREAAWKIIGTLSHPLNHAFFDEKKKRVTKGYGILQPRIATNISPISSSWYAKLHSSEIGIDPYTRAVSDVYQDALGEGSYIGKGIIDIDAFEKALGDRIPENRILSHDLLEGCHARSGLISDVELYEDYPASYLSDMKRRHRWIRGDWQIATWLLPKVPGPGHTSQKNPLSSLSRWKIADNLRRSLLPPALLALFLFGWFISPSPWFWTFIGFAMMVPAPFMSFVYTFINKSKEVDYARHTLQAVESFVTNLLQQIWTIISLPYEAFINVDAILRTSWRVLISHRYLLQWDPFTIVSEHKSIAAHYLRMWFAPVFSIILWITLSDFSIGALLIASPLLILWMTSPIIAWVISVPQIKKQPALSEQQFSFLRKISRKTWAYFENFIGAEDHYLPPDNYQEYPTPRTAHRTSPTNIGVSLLSVLAAHDFGYISLTGLLDRCKKTLDALSLLDRYKGHLYNWYDTQSLTPLFPRYISTVDSGNLAACMLTLKEGLNAMKNEPVISLKVLEGMKDILSLLSDKKFAHDTFHSLPAAVQVVINNKTPTVLSIKILFERIVNIAEEFKSIENIQAHPDTLQWTEKLIHQGQQTLQDIHELVPFLTHADAPFIVNDLLHDLPFLPSLQDLAKAVPGILIKIESINSMAISSGEGLWLSTIKAELERAHLKAKEHIARIDDLFTQCIDLSNYDYDFLYDKAQHYLTIGYNVEEHRRDPGYYDLLGSEARLGIYVAISQGKIPQESWFALGRQVTHSGKDPVLISWSGSMFEYLMPMLLMPTYENTLLDQTQKGAVHRQMEYSRNSDLPWGMSESGFNMFHANLDYQYRAFGVPGLGLKRGLANDYVIAPYATLMALMVSPIASIDNLHALSAAGGEGQWGYYEAIDYTPSRLQRGQHAVVVKSFMTHHQGMSFLALSSLLNGQLMQERFQSDLHFQTSLLLLQEKIPVTSSFSTPGVDMGEIPNENTNTELQIIHTPNTPIPEVQLLSNGRYHVMVSNAGGGYSRWKDLAVTRWREDGTCEAWGNFCYIREVETNISWSTSFQPTLVDAEHYDVIFSEGRAEFRRRDQQIESHTEIVVSPEDDVELRRLRITNRSRRKRIIEITSYAEVVLNKAVAEILHPAFSNLFVETEIQSAQHAIFCTRRPRSAEENTPWMFHLMNAHGAEILDIQYETCREAFIGRGNTVHKPQAVFQQTGLKGNEGPVLDPIVSIQYKIELKPFETITVDMIYGMGDTPSICHDLVDKYQDKHMADRALELAWTHSQVILRQINATASDALLYCRLAGSIIYANASLRADASVITKNQRGQSGLWSHSVSGDWPIVLLQIEDIVNIDLAEQLIQAHEYWTLKGLTVDLVIWNEDHGGYRQTLQTQIMSLITPINPIDEPTKPGGIFVRSSEQLSSEDRILFQTVARVIISDKLGTLEGQLSRRKWLKPVMPVFAPTTPYSRIESKLAIPKDLQFFNGLGGFTEDGKEYVTITSPNHITPAPWSNVIANPNFGTVISESGQSYTWFHNAHELRLTPWHNDPLTDAGGEHFYIRDEATGKFWSPAPLPARGRTPYVTRHGFGYSVFQHAEEGITSEMTVYVSPDKPIKYIYIKLRNESATQRQLSLTGYVEWVLGDLRHKTTMHVITELEQNSGAIIAHNSYQTEFGQVVAFFDTNESVRSITTDRTEFIGRNGTVANPLAMTRSKLSGKTGAALDPCGVIQVPVTLSEGEEHEVLFRIGTGMHINDIIYLIREGRGRAAAREVLVKVKKQWENDLSAIQIESPDTAINIISNGWLNYQTLACRLWARSGYYQSGGAFGFRDQLQDVMSLMHMNAELARNQILLSASRQFVKGDVQHWWHPPVGRGVRTKCSDDYLWLPYVTAKYIAVTGDVEILEEKIHFLETRELNADEHSVYDLPNRSYQSATLYEHCISAMEYGFQFGSHGLPLMGSGDWNDGMDRVGIAGKGESVWLGWFLYDTIQKFIPVMEGKVDYLRIERYKDVAKTLWSHLNQQAWDGEWYRRAYFDDGTPLGSKYNDECKIDAIAQSWAILSGAGDPAKSKSGMIHAGKYLVRRDEKIIQLLDPPFDKSTLNPGYIKGYVPGVRENGGQYTHAAIWMIMAYAMMRDKEKMWELLNMINPINHGGGKEVIAKYKVEPYVVAADIYATPNHKGRGGWTWYTGSAGWMYQLITEYVFGLKRKGDILVLEPCLPLHWETVTIRYRYKSSLYLISMDQVSQERDELAVVVDDVEAEDNGIHLLDDGREHRVAVVIGPLITADGR